MVTEIVLALLVIGILIYHFVYTKETNKQIMELTKAVMAKDLTDYTINKTVEDQEVVETPEPDAVLSDQADERLFDKMIKDQANSRDIEADLE